MTVAVDQVARAKAWGRMNRQAARNRAIYHRREDGERLADIGRDHGVTAHRVWQIHRREAEIVAREGGAA